MGGYIGFGSMDAQMYTSLSADYQVVFKKLSKKDTITKLKALEELNELFGKIDTESNPEPIIARFSREFAQLMESNERQIRESALNTLRVLATKVGRKLAPHLRSYIGPWLCAQFDPESVVRTAAKNSFTAAIAEKKHSEAISRLRVDILNFIREKLNQTPQTIGVEVKMSPDELEERYERIVSSCLFALVHVIETLSSEERMKTPELLDLLSDLRKHATSKHAKIRSACYALIKTLSTKFKQSLESDLKTWATFVLGLFHEKEPSTHPYMWNAMLEFMKAFPQSWQLVEYEKVTFPRLWSFLNNACYGSAEQSFLYFLPFLSFIPDDFLFSWNEEKRSEFFDNFFVNMWKGLQQRIDSIRDQTILVDSYFECLCLVIFRELTNGSRKLCERLLSTHFLQLFESFLKTEKILCTTFPQSLADFMMKLCTKSQCKDLVEWIWQQIQQMVSPFLVLSDEATSSPSGKESLSSSQLATVVCSHLAEFLVKVGHRISKVEGLLSFGLNQWLKTLFGSLSFACKFGRVSQIHLITEFCRVFPFDILLTKSKEIFFEVDFLSWLAVFLDKYTHDNNSTEAETCINLLLTMASFYFTKSSPAVSSQQWDSLLKLLCQQSQGTNKFLLILLKGVVSGDDNMKWRSQHLDNFLSTLTQNLISPENVELFKVLSFAGKTPIVDDHKRTEALSLLMKDFENYLRAFHHDITLQFVEEHTTQRIVNILDIFNAFFQNLSILNARYTIEWLMNIFKGTVYEKEPTDLISNTTQTATATIRKKIAEICQKLWEANTFKLVHSPILELQNIVNPVRNLVETTNISVSVIVAAVQSLLSHFTQHETAENLVTYLSLFDGLLLLNEKIVDEMHNELLLFLDVDVLQCGVTHFQSLETSTLLSTSESNGMSLIRYRRTITYLMELMSSFGLDFVFRRNEKKAAALNLSTNPSQREWLLLEFFFAYSLCRSSPKTSQNISLELTNKRTTATEDEWADFIESVQEWCKITLFPYLKTQMTDAKNDFIKLCFEKCLMCGGIYCNILNTILTVQTTAVSNSIATSASDSLSIATHINNTESKDVSLSTVTHEQLLSIPTNILSSAWLSCHAHELFQQYISSKTDDIIFGTFKGVNMIEATVPKLLPYVSSKVINDLKWRLLGRLRTTLETENIQLVALALLSLSCFYSTTSQSSTQIENEDKNVLIDLKNRLLHFYTKHHSHSLLTLALLKSFYTAFCSFKSLLIPSDLQFVLELCSKNLQKFTVAREEQRNWLFSFHSLMLLQHILSQYSEGDDNNSSLISKFLAEAFTFLYQKHFSNLDAIKYRAIYHTLVKELALSLRLIPSHVLASLNEEPLVRHLLFPHVEIQKTCYLLLRTLRQATLKNLSKNENNTSKNSKEVGVASEDEPEITFVSSHLLQLIEQADVYDIADFEDVASYHRKIGVLLAWALFFGYFQTESEQNMKLRMDLATYVRRKGTLSTLLYFIFVHIDQRIAPPQNTDIEELLFDCSEHSLEISEKQQQHLAQLSACVYRQAVFSLPALVRMWSTEIKDKALAARVDKYTMNYITPQILRREFELISNHKNTTKETNFTVKANKMTNEVTAIYEKDDVKLTIVLTIPSNYPLRSVSVELANRVGIQENLWRKWLLSMTTLLLTQDGTLLDAVLLWKNYLDKHFEGVECCPICYSIFHISNYSLPNLQCKTCRNKFHAGCIYKWFNTSHRNDCPLCKTPFN